jgi:hypothetical protein
VLTEAVERGEILSPLPGDRAGYSSGMRRLVAPLLATVATLLGVLGLYGGPEPIARNATGLLGFGALALLIMLPTAGFTGAGARWARGGREPRPLRLHPSWLLRAPLMWLHGFRRSYALEPGLYHTGEAWDPAAPILVTGNYLLSVIAVLRALGGRSVGLLVVDTDGINVWCASGKGRFSAGMILAELDRYPASVLGERPRLVLPKLALSGVKLSVLKGAGFEAVIGPVHARDIPGYLDSGRLRHRRHDRFHFDLRARAFAWLPGLVQQLGYAGATLLALLGVELLGGPAVPWGLAAIVAWLATAYPLLFPWLPGRRFAVKGLALGAFTGALPLLGLALGWMAAGLAASAALFAVAMGVFFGLGFTGNSAVSNYSDVRAEIARFLPVDVALFLAALITFLLTGAPA